MSELSGLISPPTGQQVAPSDRGRTPCRGPPEFFLSNHRAINQLRLPSTWNHLEVTRAVRLRCGGSPDFSLFLSLEGGGFSRHSPHPHPHPTQTGEGGPSPAAGSCSAVCQGPAAPARWGGVPSPPTPRPPPRPPREGSRDAAWEAQQKPGLCPVRPSRAGGGGGSPKGGGGCSSHLRPPGPPLRSSSPRPGDPGRPGPQHPPHFRRAGIRR